MALKFFPLDKILDLGLNKPEPVVAAPVTLNGQLQDWMREILERMKNTPPIVQPKITPWTTPYNPWVDSPNKPYNPWVDSPNKPYNPLPMTPWNEPQTIPQQPWTTQPYISDWPPSTQAPYVGDILWRTNSIQPIQQTIR
jgi:hypothetical protein